MTDEERSSPTGTPADPPISRRSLVSRAGALLAGASAAAVGLGRPSAAAAAGGLGRPSAPAAGTEVIATGLWTRSGAVDLARTAPRAGQVLTALGPTTAAWQSPEQPEAGSSGSLRTLRPRAGDPVLIDPNRANGITVVLPPAALGGVASTTITPVEGAPTTGRLWNRLIQFQQPAGGPTVDPRLSDDVIGPRPAWGSGGAGSIDVVGVVSNDGRRWMITGSASVASAVPKSILSAVTGAPAASRDPLSFPDPILLWSAADMLGGTRSGTTFVPGSRVGQDFSGSGNELIVNAGERITYERGPLPSTGRVPRVLVGFPFVHASSARAGMGCSFAGGLISDWTVIVSLLPADFGRHRVADEQPVFQTRTVGKTPQVRLAIKSGNLGYTWDGTEYNDLTWPAHTFLSARGDALPTVVGWSSSARSATEPTVLAGSSRTALTAPSTASATTRAPASIGGLDLPSSFGYCGVAVYAAALTADQIKGAALRLGFVAFGETS